jgi:hypothetical protein
MQDQIALHKDAVTGSLIVDRSQPSRTAIENFMEFIQDLVNLTDIESPTA